ncbi:MAG: hypothetical protein R3B72_52000 [Polyangiaceae bacterium]
MVHHHHQHLAASLWAVTTKTHVEVQAPIRIETSVAVPVTVLQRLERQTHHHRESHLGSASRTVIERSVVHQRATSPPTATSAPPPQPAAWMAPPVPMVLRQEAIRASREVAPAPRAAMPTPAPLPTSMHRAIAPGSAMAARPLPAQSLEHLTDHILRAIDRRVIAQRERTGGG